MINYPAKGFKVANHLGKCSGIRERSTGDDFLSFHGNAPKLADVPLAFTVGASLLMNVQTEIAKSAPTVEMEIKRRPTVVIRPTKGWAALNFRELWKYRDLLSILIERDVKLRYKQTALGVVWVILQPLIAALIFAAIFGRVAKLPSDGMPYLLFVFCGLTAWNYFSQALQRAGNSLVTNSQLVSKVYFPRLLIPLAHTLAVLLDFLVMLVVLAFLTWMYGVAPSARIMALPLFLLLITLTATGIALWFSALSVKYRDFMYALPFLIQVWMYASPVVYPASMMPDRWRIAFALNPAVGFIEGFRWCVLGRSGLTQQMLAVTVVVSLLAFISGALFFRRVERGFADVI